MAASNDLAAVVLAGGASSRMGRDKAELVYAGRPQLQRAVSLLEGFGLDVLVSVRPGRAAYPGITGRRLLDDADGFAGPAAGLAAAWQADPARALLVLAVDLPLVDVAMIRLLLERRERDRVATAFVHPDGTIEPLCTIWEPAAWPLLETRSQRRGPSLRRVLESADIARLEPPDPRRLESVNTDAEYRAAVAWLAARPTS